jgi:hypothetical protein
MMPLSYYPCTNNLENNYTAKTLVNSDEDEIRIQKLHNVMMLYYFYLKLMQCHFSRIQTINILFFTWTQACFLGRWSSDSNSFFGSLDCFFSCFSGCRSCSLISPCYLDSFFCYYSGHSNSSPDCSRCLIAARITARIAAI